MAIEIDDKCGFNKQEGHHYARYLLFGEQVFRPESYAFQAVYRGRTLTWRTRISRPDLETMQQRQLQLPVSMLTTGKRTWWWFGNRFYAVTEPYGDPQVIKGLILQWQERRDRKAARAAATAQGRAHAEPRKRATKKKAATAATAAAKKLSAWEVLDLKRPASAAEIKKAYLKQISLYHPDKVSHLGIELQKLAEEKTKQINAAYSELSR